MATVRDHAHRAAAAVQVAALGLSKGSLRAKIIAWSFFPTVIILVAVAAVIFYAYQDVTEDLVIERNQDLIRLTANQFTAELEEYAELLDAEARTADVYGNDPVAQRDALIETKNRLAIFDAGVLILNSFGIVVAAEPERPEIMEQDWSDRTYYRQILHSQTLSLARPVLSDIVADGPGGTQVILVAVPITGPHGEWMGTLAGMFRMGATAISALYGDIVKLRLGESGSAYLVDSGGQVIFHSDPDRIGDDFSSHEVVQRMLSGEVGAVRTRDLKGRGIVASYAPVPDTPWGLVAEESWTALTGPSRRYGQFLLLLLALGIVVPALVVAVGVRRITRPVTELISAAKEIARGNFGQKITAETGDELEEMAEQFNTMSAQLQESYAHLERRVAHRTKELATLHAIATTASQSLELDEVLSDALDKTLQVLEIEAGGIYVLDEEAGMLSIAVQRGFSPLFVAEIDKLKVGEGFSGRVAQSGQPLVVRDVSIDSRLTRMVVKEEGLRSLATVPLSSKGKVLGTLFALTHGYRDFTDQDIQLLTSIGHQVGVAIENTRLFEAEQHRAEQFRVISEVGRRITSILDIDELLVHLVQLIQQAFHYDHVGIALVEGEHAVYTVGAGVFWDDPEFQFQPARLKVGEEGVTGWVAGTGEPLLVPDVSQEPRYVWMGGSRTRSELAVPIKVKGEVFGVLDVQSERLNAFDTTDLTVLQSLAHQAAVAIENARLYKDAQQLAVVDERQRLARELHDSVTQSLYSSTLLAEAGQRLAKTGDLERVRGYLSQLGEITQQALREMRLLVHQLRPLALEEEGLVGALQQRLDGVERRAGVEARLVVEGEIELPAAVEEELYRIAQEALNNALKHAAPTLVTVTIRADGERPVWGAELEVKDNGRGFDPDAVGDEGGMGLVSMRERAENLGGTLIILSAPGEGATLKVVVSG